LSSYSPPPARRGPSLPPGLKVAGIGTRLGAWLIDSLIFVGFQIVFWMAADALGAIRISPEAERQMEASPMALPTVAPYQVNLPLLAVMLAGFVVVSVVYATFCWARFRGMPGQRLLSLQVGDAVTGRNLGLRRAAARSVVAVGIPIAAGAGFLYGVMAFETSVPWSEVVSMQTGGQADTWVTTWSGAFLLAMVLAVGWPVLLLISTAASSSGQGLHDRLAQSIVIGKAAPAYGVPAWTAPAFGGPALIQPVDGEPAWTEAAADSNTPATFHAATVGRRVAGYLIDCTIVYLSFSMVAAAVAAASMPSNATAFDERTYIFLGLVGGLIQLVYFTVGWAMWRGTPGQRLMHMRVGDATTGKALSWMDALARWAVLQGPFALVTIVPAIARTPVLMAASCWIAYLLYSMTTDPDVRGLHDRFLNSRVGLEP